MNLLGLFIFLCLVIEKIKEISNEKKLVRKL